MKSKTTAQQKAEPATAAVGAKKARSRRSAQEAAMAERWGGHVILHRNGWVPIPKVLLRYGAQLKPHGLTPAEMLFVIQLMAYQRKRDKPFPAYKTVARQMGVTPQYTRQIARNLDNKKLLKRDVRVGRTNKFDLTPLFDALAAHIEQLQSTTTVDGADIGPGAAGRP